MWETEHTQTHGRNTWERGPVGEPGGRQRSGSNKREGEIGFSR